MTNQKNHFFIPLIVAAASSVVAFSGIGVAAITGHLSITHSNLNPFSSFARTPSSGLIQAPMVSAERHEGLTRNRGESAIEGKPVNFQFGARVAARKAVCPDCGVVDSISPGHSGVAVRDAAHFVATPPDGMDMLKTSGKSAEGATAGFAGGFVVRVHMENGSTRTIYETERPAFSVGERIKLVNGSVIRIG
ncbi:MAG TPA: hypothetical protein VHB46_13015 [Burkholderiales bacterium]|nr:hypothetical protein [Burkholderiales bacterium]